jgi:hypothetical protein
MATGIFTLMPTGIELVPLAEQVKKYVRLGAHDLLGLSADTYAAGLLKAAVQIPEGYSTRFVIPVLVDARLPIDPLLQKAGIKSFLDLAKVDNAVGDSKTAYLMWTHDSHRYYGLCPSDAQKKFVPDEVGCTLLELVAFFCQFPLAFSGIAMDALLSRFRGEYHPSLIGVTSRPEIASHWYKDVTPGMNTLSKGKTVQALG